MTIIVRRRAALAAGICAAIAALVIPWVPTARLITRDGQTLYRAPPLGRVVWICYTHSVNRTLVEDGFTIDDSGVKLMMSRYRDYGAGIAQPEGDQTLEIRDGFMELGNINRHMPVVWTYTGRTAGHYLRLGDGETRVEFDSLTEPGCLIGLSPGRDSPIMLVSDALIRLAINHDQ